MNLVKDETNRDLGLRYHRCRICGLKGDFQSYLVREMMMGTRDEFEYFVCPHCGSLQITDIPDNLGSYYGNAYYSVAFKVDENYQFKAPVTNMNAVLDVGCGSGELLFKLAEEGYGNLYGCDPYIEKDIEYGDRVHIKKCEIGDLEGEGCFDYIKMNDSLEHVPNPCDVLIHAKRLLRSQGIIEINTPNFPNMVFDLFQTHWFQLDAPRHINILSEQAFRYLANESGLTINRIDYDQVSFSFFCSFFYQHGVTYEDIQLDNGIIDRYFGPQEREKIDKLCEAAIQSKRGDHIRVVLVKE